MYGIPEYGLVKVLPNTTNFQTNLIILQYEIHKVDLITVGNFHYLKSFSFLIFSDKPTIINFDRYVTLCNRNRFEDPRNSFVDSLKRSFIINRVSLQSSPFSRSVTNCINRLNNGQHPFVSRSFYFIDWEVSGGI